MWFFRVRKKAWLETYGDSESITLSSMRRPKSESIFRNTTKNIVDVLRIIKNHFLSTYRESANQCLQKKWSKRWKRSKLCIGSVRMMLDQAPCNWRLTSVWFTNASGNSRDNSFTPVLLLFLSFDTCEYLSYKSFSFYTPCLTTNYKGYF